MGLFNLSEKDKMRIEELKQSGGKTFLDICNAREDLKDKTIGNRSYRGKKSNTKTKRHIKRNVKKRK